VASPHHLASSAGLDVLASGGNALDAAVATNLTLGVVTPYLCGFGGDLFALLWKDSQVFAYNGSGRAPAGATVDAVRAAAGGDRVPTFGPHTVTVPGAAEAWFVLLDRFGTRSFDDLARPALRYASDGFIPSDVGTASLGRATDRYAWSEEWMAAYGGAQPGARLRQQDLARTIEMLCSEGPDVYYRGPIADAMVEHLRSLGGLMAAEDMAAHHGEFVEPLHANYRGVNVLELPPNTQGVTALEALNIVSACGALSPDGPERQHLLIEAMKLALSDRDRYVTDPDHMQIAPGDLLSRKWAAERAQRIDRRVAGRPVAGSIPGGGTAYVCATDADGMCVSLIQSNWMGFGSGLIVPGWGINLHNRGALFSLDPGHVNVIAPRKRTLHTLIPAMALREGRPWLVFGTMGGHGQGQTHLQLLVRIIDDAWDIQDAIDAPRWVVSPEDWSVTAEDRFGAELLEELRERGHRVEEVGPFDPLLGHAHAIMVTDQGYAGAFDPRSEGAVLGF
jgi:gamma-glutamyltranspeptidase/glutathione hydrolase